MTTPGRCQADETTNGKNVPRGTLWAMLCQSFKFCNGSATVLTHLTASWLHLLPPVVSPRWHHQAHQRTPASHDGLDPEPPPVVGPLLQALHQHGPWRDVVAVEPVAQNLPGTVLESVNHGLRISLIPRPGICHHQQVALPVSQLVHVRSVPSAHRQATRVPGDDPPAHEPVLVDSRWHQAVEGRDRNIRLHSRGW